MSSRTTRARRRAPARRLSPALIIVAFACLGLIVVGGLALARPATPDPAAALPRANVKGAAEAPITVVEYEDAQCPACRRAALGPAKELEPLIANGTVKLEVRHYAVQGEASTKAAEALECAGEQGRFFDLRQRLFGLDPTRGAARFAPASLKGVAAELGLDGAAFGACLDSGRYRGRVAADVAAARQLGVDATPTFIVGDRRLVGIPRDGELTALLQAARAGR